MKIIITGTHFTPAVAVIEELKNLDNNLEIIYIGRKTTREGDPSPSLESQIIPKMGVRFIPIISGRLQRSFTIYTIPSLLKIPIGLVQSLWLVFRHQPELVVSFGGYISVPVVISAWLLSIPVLIHEQTLVSGLANKISSWFADKIAVSFASDYQFDFQKTVLTGNPLRKEILNPQKANERCRKFIAAARREGKKVVFVTGGNQGSHIINQTIGDGLEQLLKQYYLIHQTGDSAFNDDQVLEQKRLTLGNKLADRYLVSAFIKEGMGYLIKEVDVVVSRAGINTLTEVVYSQTPAVVIPITDHYEQNTNATYFAKLGFIKLLPQRSLSADQLQTAIKEALSLKINSQQVQQVIIKDAAQRIALEIMLMLNKLLR